VRGAEKRQAGVAELAACWFQKAGQFGTVARFPVLPGRFQSGAVGKSAGGKGRVSQLPKHPVVVWNDGLASVFQNKEYRWASGRILAGAQTSGWPSAVTSYVSGSTVMRGVASFHFMSFLPSRRQPLDGFDPLVQAVTCGDALVAAKPADESDGTAPGARPKAPNIGPHQNRLRRGDGGVGIAHLRPGDEAAFENHFRLDAEKGRLPQHQIGQFARFDRADAMRHAVRNRGD
jgi:hypothetical protein